MSRSVVIAAMEGELKCLVQGWARERRGGVTLWRGPSGALRVRAGGDDGPKGPDGEDGPDLCIAACAGVGAEAALRALAEAEKDAPADALVSAGWAGALDAACLPGRAYRASGVVDASDGAWFPAAGGGAGPRLVSSPTVAAEAEKRRFALEHGAQLVDMEAAALARLAALRGIPFYAIKGVSDGPTESLPDFSRFISEDGGFQFGRFAVFALLRPALWPVLARLGRNSRRAAQGIAASLLELLRI